MGDLVPMPRPKAEIATVSRLRAELEEAKAQKSLPRLQRVIGAATVAAEAQRRVARLADGQGSPTEIVAAAREGSRQAATVQLEAMAEAGRLLAEMKDAGILLDGPGHPANSPEGGELPLRKVLGAKSNSGAEHHAKRWEMLSAIPDEIREEYLKDASVNDRDITATGLIRYAAGPKEATEREGQPIQEAYKEVMSLMSRLTNYRAAAIAAYASDSRSKTKFRQEVERLEAWLERVRDILK